MAVLRSIVAGIVDKDGSLNRVVITHPGNLRFHVNKGEHSVRLPGRKVIEPVSNDEAYELIQAVEEHIKTRPTRRVL